MQAMSQVTTLDAVGLKHGTDKSSAHHDYLNFYETFLGPLRNKTLNILEVGVLNGASLLTWEEYFPNANIVGADISYKTKQFERNRVSIEIIDQSNVEELTNLAIKHGPFDIIIEDGSHMWEHQITSLRTLFPFVKHEGIYIVEDLQTNFGTLDRDYRGIASFTCVDYLKKWVDLRVADEQIPIHEVEDAFLRTYGRAVQFLTFHRHACLIKKNFAPVNREESAGHPLIKDSPDDSWKPLSILAHVAHRGDVFGKDGFVYLGSPNFTFQGVSIHLSEEVLEYRVRFVDKSWGEWCRSRQFAGTRAQSKLITGITVRLLENAKDRYTVRTFARFVDSNGVVEVSDGQDCISISGEAMCGLQVVVKTRFP